MAGTEEAAPEPANPAGPPPPTADAPADDAAKNHPPTDNTAEDDAAEAANTDSPASDAAEDDARGEAAGDEAGREEARAPAEDDAPADDAENDAATDEADDAHEAAAEDGVTADDAVEEDAAAIEPPADEAAEDDAAEGNAAEGNAADEAVSGEDAAEEERAEEVEAPAGDDESEEDGEPRPLPPVEPASVMELMAAYRQPATAGGERLPWSWATLSAGERQTSATLIDGFVTSYNHTWAISKEQAVPPCWHLHPALAHDLAALAWAYYQAYRDPTATPERALRFQAELLPFAKRMNRWLGRRPGECRAGRHDDAWRDAEAITGSSRRSRPADTDAVTLLGIETFGFARESGRPADDA